MQRKKLSGAQGRVAFAPIQMLVLGYPLVFSLAISKLLAHILAGKILAVNVLLVSV